MVLEMLLDGALLLRRVGDRLPLVVEERLHAMAAASRVLAGESGIGPMLGDADDGALWRFAARHTDDHRPAIALAAGLLGSPRRAEQPPVELLWLTGPEGCAAYDLAPVAAAEGDRAFPQGGLFRMDGAGLAALIDCGQLGMGPGGHGGHGHLDCLSLTATVDGQPILVDPGTYTYTGDLAWRGAFRRTAAHNTVAVDGAEQAELTGPWTLDNRCAPMVHLWHSGLRFALLDGSHSGFERLAAPVRHRRQVVFVRGAYWLVVDTLFGAGRRRVERWWHLAPARVDLSADAAVVGLSTLAWAPVDGQRDWIVEGDEPARAGWVSPAYGERVPAPVLSQRIEAELPLQLPLLIWPRGGAVRLAPDGMLQWRVERPGGVDVLRLEPASDPLGPLGLVLRLADGDSLVAETTVAVDGVPPLPHGARERLIASPR
jgi:hypothetical protein